ncbi:hypothetical protein ACO0R3_002691 [Hanseniaspora guilliermondii]
MTSNKRLLTHGLKTSAKRKKHKNSKLGCKECKSRRIKCDTNLQILNTNKYSCLNCLLRWMRSNENDPSDNDHICSFSSLTSDEIIQLKKEIHAKEFIDYHEMNEKKIYPINKIQIILSNEDLQQNNENCKNIKTKIGFEITMIPHNQIEVPSSLKVKRVNETSNQVNSRIALAQMCISGLNFVNRTTVNYYTSLAINSFIARLKKFYISELKGMDAIFDHQKSFNSTFLFDSNRHNYEEHLSILNSVPTFDEKRNLIIKYIKLSQDFLQEKLFNSYKTIKTSLDVIIKQKCLISYGTLINCHIGSYILRIFELYSLVTDEYSMNRYIEHFCSSFEICWELNKILQQNIDSGNTNTFIDTESISRSTYDYEFKDTITGIGGDNICIFALSMASFNQNYIHMKSVPIDFVDELQKMLLEFGNTFILSQTNDDIDVDSLLKEDFKNLALFIEQFIKTSVFMDMTKALPLQPNLLWQLTHKFFQMKPKKIFNVSLNLNINAKILLNSLTSDKFDSYLKYSDKKVIDDYNKSGYLTPVEKVLYMFYIAIDLVFVNILPSRLYVYDNEAYGVCGWNMPSFDAIIFDLDLNMDVDKKLLPFINYIYRLASYMYRRKILFSEYTCLNNFYDDENLLMKSHNNKVQTSENFLNLPCYASRLAYNIKEVNISSFLNSTIRRENYFGLDIDCPLPLELLIAFKSNYQHKLPFSLKGPYINKKGHYWDGNFYLIKYTEYTKYHNKQCELNERYQKHLNLYFKNILLFDKLFKDYYEATGKVFPKFNEYDLSILATEGLENVYKFNEQVITKGFISTLSKRLMVFKDLISNIFVFQNKQGIDGVFINFVEEKIIVKDYHLLLTMFVAIVNDQCDSESRSILSSSTNVVNIALPGGSKVFSSDRTDSECVSSTVDTSLLDQDGIRASHYSSLLVSNCGLFKEDYDPLLGLTIDEYMKLKNNKSNYSINKNQEDNVPELHFFLPDFKYLKMIRRDKKTLLFNDGRDEEDE